MQPRRRRPPPPWERRTPEPRHPTGRTRRRWPTAYDGGAPAEPRLNPRYRRAFDGGVPGGPVSRGRSAFQRIRRNPVRHGLIGLAIAGTAAPVAMTRHQQRASRMDPSHEQILSQNYTSRLTEQAVAQTWQQAEDAAATRKKSSREAKIQEKLDRYAEMGLSRELAESIYDIALEEDIDPDVAFGVVRTESEFKATAKSHVGAIGLTQLMPNTARWLRPGTTTSDLKNPEINLRIGFQYLKDLIEKYDGDTHLALLAYNRGPGTVDRVLKRGGNPDNGYSEAVITGEGVH